MYTNAIVSVRKRHDVRIHVHAHTLDHGVGVVMSIKFGLTKENVLPPGLLSLLKRFKDVCTHRGLLHLIIVFVLCT